MEDGRFVRKGDGMIFAKIEFVPAPWWAAVLSWTVLGMLVVVGIVAFFYFKKRDKP